MFRFPIVLLLLCSCWLSEGNVYAKSEIPQKCEQATMVDSFLSGLQAETPKQAVELWILGVKNRSGAVQFATLSPTLQKNCIYYRSYFNSPRVKKRIRIFKYGFWYACTIILWYCSCFDLILYQVSKSQE